MANQKIKDWGLLFTMLLTICSVVFHIGYTYNTINETAIKVQQLEESKVSVDVYLAKHEGLKENIAEKLEQNNKDHGNIIGDLKTMDIKLTDIQRKVDKLTKANDSNESGSPALARGN